MKIDVEKQMNAMSKEGGVSNIQVKGAASIYIVGRVSHVLSTTRMINKQQSTATAIMQTFIRTRAPPDF
jgi:hypothetical protein